MGSKTQSGAEFELDDSRDNDSEYVLRNGSITIKFSTVEWAGGSWILKNGDTEVAIVLDRKVDGLREVYDSQE